MTVARLRRDMTSSEFTEWWAFDVMESERIEKASKRPSASEREEAEELGA